MIGICICTLIRVHLISAALYELEIERCVVLTRAIAERREVVDVKRGSLQTPSAPAGSWLTVLCHLLMFPSSS